MLQTRAPSQLELVVEHLQAHRCLAQGGIEHLQAHHCLAQGGIPINIR